MEIKITGQNLTDAMKTHIVEKFKQIHKPEKLMDIEFKIKKNGTQEHVAFLGKLGKENLIIENNNNDFYTAVNLLMDKIKANFSKLKKSKHKVPSKRLAI